MLPALADSKPEPPHPFLCSPTTHPSPTCPPTNLTCHIRRCTENPESVTFTYKQTTLFLCVNSIYSQAHRKHCLAQHLHEHYPHGDPQSSWPSPSSSAAPCCCVLLPSSRKKTNIQASPEIDSVCAFCVNINASVLSCSGGEEMCCTDYPVGAYFLFLRSELKLNSLDVWPSKAVKIDNLQCCW